MLYLQPVDTSNKDHEFEIVLAYTLGGNYVLDPLVFVEHGLLDDTATVGGVRITHYAVIEGVGSESYTQKIETIDLEATAKEIGNTLKEFWNEGLLYQFYHGIAKLEREHELEFPFGIATVTINSYDEQEVDIESVVINLEDNDITFSNELLKLIEETCQKG